MRSRQRGVAAILLPLMLSVPALAASTALADPQGSQGKPHQHASNHAAQRGGNQSANQAGNWIAAGISTRDARRLAQNANLTGAKPLPPGIRKNLARGRPLPPGIAKTRLPRSYISALPRHTGYEWQMAGSDLVLISTGSQVVSDVLRGVFD